MVAGQTHSEIIFEILGRKGELTPQQLSSRDKYLEGLAAYREQRWDDALRALNASLEAMPGDGPSMALLKRIESLKANPPSPGLGRVVAHRKIVVTGQHPRSICSVRIEGCRKQLWRLPGCFCKRWLLRRILPEAAPVFVLETERANEPEKLAEKALCMCGGQP